ncbi:MAG: CinA family nicotinamide mononucleotide deamidase-related protein [bacterium]|jgi:nicotinamide-nucleotide amidase
MKLSNSINASLVTIGDELLIGQTIDTNSAWMAKELNNIGITIKRRVAVGDHWDDIWNCLQEEGETADVVLITGGLGPTSDDITKPLLCKFFGGSMVTDKAALENVIDIFTKKLNRPLLDRNLKQAEVPDNCIVLQNKRGTAPGMLFEKENTIYVSMPGVPHEMKGMMHDDVLPLLKQRFSLSPVQHRTLLTAGIGESFLAEILTDFENSLSPDIKLAYLPNYGMVRLRLTSTQSQSKEDIDSAFIQLKKIVKDYLVVDEDLSLQETISNILKSKKQTLSIAESCTGGYISHLITLIPGSSSFFLGSIISYSNEMKSNVLDVPTKIIKDFGAVSIETVAKMAEGIRLKTGSDFALATSGIMGPDGGSAEKSVGHVCVAVSSANKTETTTFDFRFDRKRNIELTAAHALNFLLKNIR